MNRTRFAAVLSLSVLLLAGCSSNSGETEEVATILAPPGVYQTTTEAIPDSILDALTYEEITGTLTPGQGGAMGDYLTTWPKNCYFGLLVPPGAVQYETSFVMRIPTKASHDSLGIGDQLIIRLSPESESFQEPITVYATWMPWCAPPPANLIYESADTDSVPEVTYIPGIRRYVITFQVDHFSDWRVGPGPRN